GSGGPEPGTPPPPRAVLGEAAERPPARHAAGEPGAIVPLIEEEPRLLSFERIDEKAEPSHRHLGPSALLPAPVPALERQPLEGAKRRVRPQDHGPGTKHGFEHLADGLPAGVDPEGEHAHRQDIAVAVHDETGQAVAFARDQAQRVVSRIEAFAIGEGALDLLPEELGVDL